MPRTIPSGIASNLSNDALTLCYIVSITLSSGVVLAFTSHDQPVTVSGVTYEPANTKTATSIKQGVGTGIDNLEFLGAIDSALITEAQLMGGTYDAAKIFVGLADWSDVAAGKITLLTGYVGQIETTDGINFMVEVRSLTQRLQQNIGWQVSPTCRCQTLGDLQCKFNLGGSTLLGHPSTLTLAATAISADGLTITLASDTTVTGYWAYGTAKGSSGNNAGFTKTVKSHSISGGTSQIVLSEPFPYLASPGDTFVLTTGCDRTFATCQTKFGNANNFHGEPNIPTNDVMQVIGNPTHS